jgi:DNA-binding transcriptional regulator YiaG
MNALKHIRIKVFAVKQQEFAAIAGVQQSTVSRWENGTAAPSLEEMNRIRADAEKRRADKRLKAKWDDRLFFADHQEANAA